MKRFHDLRSDDGSMLLALLMTMVLVALAGVMVVTTVSEATTVRHDQRYTDELPAADAAVNRALFMLNNGLTSSLPATLGASPFGTISVGSQSVAWSATAISGTTPPAYAITASVTSGGTTRVLKATAYQSARFGYSFFANTSVVFRGGNTSDSYNSNTGNLNTTGHGGIASNGSVTLNGNAGADSVTLYNWTADPNTARCSGGPCSSGYSTVGTPFDITSAAATQFIQNGLSACSQPLSAYTSSTNGTTLPSGTWCASSLNLDVNTTVSGPTVIYVSGNVTTSHHLTINYASGVEPVPANLQIYMLGSTYDMANHTTIAAAIYAPYATCNGGAQSVVYGSMVCGSISNQGGWTFHYDDALANVGAGDFRIKNYREG